MRHPPGLNGPTLSSSSIVPFDITRRYVRFRERHANGYVEFDFSIGDPLISVELVMQEVDYEAFCAEHNVTYLSDADAAAIDDDQQKWRFGQPGLSE